MIRPRDRRRRDWPTGLRESRPGYFTWRNPANGQEMTIGRVTLADAKSQANAANEYVLSQKPTLLERLTGAAHTVGELLDAMPAAANKNTAKSWRSLDKKIRENMGDLPCSAVTVKHCADLLEKQADEGKKRTAQALRSRMVAVFAKGMSKGWMDFNPAEPTVTESVEVKRGRLTFEMFKAILEQAPKITGWLEGAMILGVVTGLDRSTIASLRRPMIGAEYLSAQRGKTGVWIEIPLALRLEAMGLSLREALAACESGIRSFKKPDRDFIVHHRREFGNAPLGSGVHPDNISDRFTEARKLAKIPDVLPDGKLAPTFHEIRSLAKRLYDKQGNVDTKALLGHLTDEMSELYADPRGIEPIRVKIK
jgi:hypothetical protein